jgi:hypothetical protein
VRLVDEKSWMEDDGLYFLVGSGDLGWCVWLTSKVGWKMAALIFWDESIHRMCLFEWMGATKVFLVGLTRTDNYDVIRHLNFKCQ